jgi:endopeptidase La
MAEISLKDYHIHCLQKEYKRHSTYLSTYQNHIEKCYQEAIISLNDRNKLYKTVNDLLRKINIMYNVNMLKICNNNDCDNNADNLTNIFLSSNLSSDQNDNKDDVDVYEDLRNLINLYKIMKIELPSVNNNLHNEHFYQIKDGILNLLSSKIGFKSIHDCLSLLIGDQYIKIYNDKTIIDELDFYNNTFIPLSYDIKKLKKRNISGNIFIKKIDPIKEVLLENCAELYIQQMNADPNTFIILKGYFVYDPLNITIRTAQICNGIIETKKNIIENHILKNTSINEQFAKNYIKHVHICDILTNTKETFVTQLINDHTRYKELSNMSYVELMNEFNNDNNKSQNTLKNMFTIIKLFLIGSDNNAKEIAGNLYETIRNKKFGINFSIAHIIFKNLSFVFQINLKRASINIKNELEKIKNLTPDDVDLRKQVHSCKNMPISVKKSTLEKIEEMKSSGSEFYKQMLYVKTLLAFPWASDDNDTFFANIGDSDEKKRQFLENFNNVINDKVYGHAECKESISELIGLWSINPSSSGSAIGLCGPPGVGKTLIARAIAEALGLPYAQITLGGQNDGDLLHGHGYTYSASQPGMLIKKMVSAGNARCVICFDELDKVSTKNNEIYDILIHLIDPNSNKEFQDRFFQDINFPFNKVLFIFSYNDAQLINKVLLDRIEQKNVKPFKIQDKIIIVNKFFMKELCTEIKFEPDTIKIKNDMIEFLIDEYTYEAGVRDIRRKLKKIFMKMNLDKIFKNNAFKNNKKLTNKKPLVITKDLIIKYLGKPNVSIQKIHTENKIGVINGLYATDGGKGGVLQIQIYNNYTSDNDKFMLRITGSQRRVMRESVITAFTTAMNYIDENERKQFINDNLHGFHIHAPGGAVPKDGPSAGCAFATAFLSRILNKKIRNDIAMTGEIELTGKVTQIGGLQYKLTGAKKAGVKLVLVSDENKEDLDTIKKEYPDIFKDGFDVKLINNLKDVLQYALID